MFLIQGQKKDKKIFHALGTKDIQIAKKKQVEYDRKYKNKIIKTSERISNKRILLLFIFVLIIFFGIYLKNMNKASQPENPTSDIPDSILTESMKLIIIKKN